MCISLRSYQRVATYMLWRSREVDIESLVRILVLELLMELFVVFRCVRDVDMASIWSYEVK